MLLLARLASADIKDLKSSGNNKDTNNNSKTSKLMMPNKVKKNGVVAVWFQEMENDGIFS